MNITRQGTVKRLNYDKETVTMRHGLGNSYQEPKFCALVYDEQGQYVAKVGNSSLLCLSEGSVRALDATDQQILDAVLSDVSI